MEIEAGGEFDQIELETGMGIRGMKVTRFTEEERQLSWVVMGTTPVLKSVGTKMGTIARFSSFPALLHRSKLLICYGS
jgi:hypothetical protein